MSNPIKVYIVEDMAIARASLETMLLENNYALSGSTAKAETAWEELQTRETDLILIDINLAGDQNGIWLAQLIRKHFNISIIYLTAYGDQQTLKEVLKTKPDGFLMKPYQEATLLTTIAIALSNFTEKQIETNPSSSSNSINDFIFIKDSLIRIKLNVNDIYFIKSEGNYLEIILKNKTHVVRSKLSEFKNLLPEDIFFQNHQRYIINITNINQLGKDFININNQDIPLSSKYKKAIENAIVSSYY